MDWTRANEQDALRSLDLAKPGFSKNGMLTDDDLSIEWGFIQQQTKKTHVPVSIAHELTLLKEAQRSWDLVRAIPSHGKFSVLRRSKDHGQTANVLNESNIGREHLQGDNLCEP
jgi:hypothetical protein